MGAFYCHYIFTVAVYLYCRCIFTVAGFSLSLYFLPSTHLSCGFTFPITSHFTFTVASLSLLLSLHFLTFTATSLFLSLHFYCQPGSAFSTGIRQSALGSRLGTRSLLTSIHPPYPSTHIHSSTHTTIHISIDPWGIVCIYIMLSGRYSKYLITAHPPSPLLSFLPHRQSPTPHSPPPSFIHARTHAVYIPTSQPIIKKAKSQTKTKPRKQQCNKNRTLCKLPNPACKCH